MAGRRPKPTAAKILAGNPGKRKLSKAEPRPAAGSVDPPRELSAGAKTEWRAIAPRLARLGLLTEVDRATLAAYCDAVATWREMCRVIAKEGSTYRHAGIIRKRPEVAIKEQALRAMRQYGGEFGMTPASRTRVAAALANTGAQAPLPGLDLPEQRDPEKTVPAVPDAPIGAMSDDEFFGVRQ